MTPMVRLLVASGIVFFFVPLALCQESDKQFDQKALIKAGRESAKRFETESASWTATCMSPTGTEFVTDVIKTSDMRRWVISARFKGRLTELCRIIQKDNVWFVTQRDKAAKYRPFEAPFDLPTAYMYLNRSDPQFCTEEVPDGFGEFKGIENRIATFRQPVDEPIRHQLETTISQFERFKESKPEGEIKPELAKTMNSAKELLANGIMVGIDLKNGIVLQFGAPEHRTSVTKFRWLKRVDAKEFNTEGRQWEDFTNDPTIGESGDLLMIGHCAFWEPGMATPDTDGRLLDLKTGQLRRIPFRGDLVSSGCFSKDRSRVVVAGTVTMANSMGLYEIDLKTTENRQLGGDLLATGVSLFPSLSPDGKTVAVLHKEPTAGILDVQICLVDLESGVARRLEKPTDPGRISWFPDGKGLLILDRNFGDGSKPPINTICRMDLDGQIKKLCAGSNPVFLGDGTRILFEERDSRTWKTCNLDGEDIQDYGDGLKGYGIPAPSPDGKRLVMMHFQTGKAPEPIVFDIGSNEGTRATSIPGFWAMPAWK